MPRMGCTPLRAPISSPIYPSSVFADTFLVFPNVNQLYICMLPVCATIDPRRMLVAQATILQDCPRALARQNVEQIISLHLLICWLPWIFGHVVRHFISVALTHGWTADIDTNNGTQSFLDATPAAAANAGSPLVW